MTSINEMKSIQENYRLKIDLLEKEYAIALNDALLKFREANPSIHLQDYNDAVNNVIEIKQRLLLDGPQYAVSDYELYENMLFLAETDLDDLA